MKIRERTISLWSFLNSRKEFYLSGIPDTLKEVRSKDDPPKREILPETSISHMRFWVEHFGYYWKRQIPNISSNLEINSEM